MALKSRTAQEKLAELENASAPFDDHLLEAAKFIKIDLESVGRSLTQTLDSECEYKAAIYHGREEWLLRWLLRRLQSPKDDVARKTTNSWILLCHLIRVIPLPNAARMLSERKFMTILKQTLEEAQKVVGSVMEPSNTSENDSRDGVKISKAPKKRKRLGDLVVASTTSRNHQNLAQGIFAAVTQIVRFTNVTSKSSNGERIAAFSFEYMKSVIMAPAEDAAKILGSWLSICSTFSNRQKAMDTVDMKLWLSTFIEIWESRIAGNEDPIQFSLYCSRPLLSLLRAVKARDALADWEEGLEQLLARNIIIPAKAAKLDNTDSDLLSTLTRISVIQDSENAPILFEVAIRSIQSQGSRRRRLNDEYWLQAVFDMLKDAMPPQRAEENHRPVRAMLQSATKYKVDLELSTLRSVTSEYGLRQSSTNWELLAAIIRLDANIFLIPHDGKDVLQELMTRITATSLESTWADISVQVVEDVLGPLMNGFAKARNLSVFTHSWYAQLVEFEKLRKEARLSSMAVFSAWEDEILQAEFSKIMEASLTVTQITQLLDWLSLRVAESPNAVCVILEAIARSVTQVEVVDVVGLRLFHIMFDNGASERLNGRYKWRSWRLLSRMLDWITSTGQEEIIHLWEQNSSPFSSISHKFDAGSLLEVIDDHTIRLEILEALRCVCAAWSISGRETRLEALARKPILAAFRALAQDIILLPRKLVGDQDLGEEHCGSTYNTLYRGIGWMLWSCVHCVFIEYPKILGLGFEMGNTIFRDMLQTVFWIASVPKDDPSPHLNAWLYANPDAFARVWIALLNDEVFNNTTLVGQLLDVMLCSETNKDNILIKPPAINAFAIECLLRLPLDAFFRKDREIIMRGWAQMSGEPANDATEGLSYESSAMTQALLSLKVKIMQRPTVYDGMKYQDLADLADSLVSAKIHNADVSLALFRELVKRTMLHITANLDQPRNREYALDALCHLRKKTKAKSDSKKSQKLNFAIIALFDALLGVFSVKEAQLNDLGIILSAGFSSVKKTFKNCLLAQLKDLLVKTAKLCNTDERADKLMALRSTIDALATLEVDESELVNMVNVAKSFTASLDKTDMDVGRRLETFLSTHIMSADVELVESQFKVHVSTGYVREAIAEKVHAFTGNNQAEKLKFLQSVLVEDDVANLTLKNLWTVRHIIMTCEDLRLSTKEDEKEDSFDLSTAYSTLCNHLSKTTTVRQFCLVSETLALMLRTKSRSMNQWNIDSTLGSITTMCSRSGSSLRPVRAGTIYKHLCQLLQTLLSSHRLKLQGHFHLIVQTVQSLLRCLFVLLPHSASKTANQFNRPPWLSSPKHQLSASHGAAFTRLVTMVCNPSVSSVARAKQNNLTSATDKAKRIAGQHMQFVLTLYVQLQLEMKMLPEVKEKLIPGIYAIFDTTTPEMRRMVGDSLDSSGRALFGTLFRDYQRFGKWKGS